MFKDATRQNFTELPIQSAAEGSRLYFELPHIGLLSKLFLTFSGTVTAAKNTGSVALSDRGIWPAIKRIRLLANSGTAIFDVSGYGAFIINNALRYGHAPDLSFVDRGTGSEIYGAGVADGANAWKGCLEIPVALNDRDAVGLILLQNNATQLTLEVEMANAIGGADNFAAVKLSGDATAALSNGKISVMMEYFTVPRKADDYPALNMIHQFLEVQDSVPSVGAMPKTLLRGDTYVRLFHYLTLNGALNTTAIEKLRILYNQSEQPYIISKITQLAMHRARYGFDLPKGTFIHDWFMSGGMPNYGDARDMINSANVTEFQSELTIASGATLGSGNNFLNTITEKLIKIA